MTLQRAQGAEIWVRYRLSNGPLRVQSNAILSQSILQRWAHVSCQGYVSTLQVHFFSESRWHRGYSLFVLGSYSAKDIFVSDAECGHPKIFDFWERRSKPKFADFQDLKIENQRLCDDELRTFLL